MSRSSSVGRRTRSLARACLGVIVVVAAGAATAQAGSLPDNRGWEIVTPPDQDMDAITRFWTTADGDMTAFSSLGAFAGALNGSTNGYVTTRGAGSWMTQAVTPPGGAGTIYNLVDLSDDGRRSIWAAADLIAGTKNDIWVRAADQPVVNVSRSVKSAPSDTAEYQGRSANGDHVLFVVDPGIANGPLQLYDHSGGVSKPVGILPGQTTPAPGGSVLGSFDQRYDQGSVFNAVSPDGSKIFFESPAPPRSTTVHYPYAATGLYVRENGTTTTQIDPHATFWGAAVDGSKAVYTPVDGSDDRGLSIYDVAARQSKQIVPPSAQVQGLGGISDDASRIYFVALAKLVDGATAGEPNLYLYDAGTMRFVATVNPQPYANGDPGDAAGYGGNGFGGSAGPTTATSADGRILAFRSTKQLTSHDNGGKIAIYVYDASKPSQPLACISCRPDGKPSTGDAAFQDYADSNSPAPPEPATNVTADGRRIFFQTSDPLDPRDINEQIDVYEWTDGKAHLISSGTGDFSRFNVASPSGDDVFFNTTNVLVPQNVAPGLRVIYDARVDGGFTPPPATTPCEQDGTCQGPPSAPPRLDEPGSIGFTGPGNLDEQPAPLPGAKQAPAFRVGAISRKARVRLARTGRMTVKVRVGAAGRVSAAMRARVGKRTRRIAHASRTARKGGTVRLTLRLSKAARSELRRGHRLRVRTVVRYSKARGAKQASFTLAPAKQKRGR